MALSYNLGYQESILVHPTRRQIFAGKPYSTFPNIWQWVVSKWYKTNRTKHKYLSSCKRAHVSTIVLRVKKCKTAPRLNWNWVNWTWRCSSCGGGGILELFYSIEIVIVCGRARLFLSQNFYLKHIHFFGVESKKAMYFFPSFKSATKLLAVEGSQQREHTEGDRKQIFLAVNTS